jgi:hypothetical protein
MSRTWQQWKSAALHKEDAPLLIRRSASYFISSRGQNSAAGTRCVITHEIALGG